MSIQELRSPWSIKIISVKQNQSYPLIPEEGITHKITLASSKNLSNLLPRDEIL